MKIQTMGSDQSGANHQIEQSKTGRKERLKIADDASMDKIAQS